VGDNILKDKGYGTKTTRIPGKMMNWSGKFLLLPKSPGIIEFPKNDGFF
jgi:hypothetical protein